MHLPYIYRDFNNNVYISGLETLKCIVIDAF